MNRYRILLATLGLLAASTSSYGQSAQNYATPQASAQSYQPMSCYCPFPTGYCAFPQGFCGLPCAPLASAQSPSSQSGHVAPTPTQQVYTVKPYVIVPLASPANYAATPQSPSYASPQGYTTVPTKSGH